MSVELADPPELTVTVDGLTDALGPEGRTEVESVTVPAKPLRLPNWSREMPGEPARTVRDVEVDEIVKSTTLTVNCTEWERDPIVPETVTVKVPTVSPLTVRVEEAVPPGLRLTLAGLAEAARPTGVTDVERLIVPVKPAWLLRTMEEMPEEPACIVTTLGLEEMVKSPTPTVNVVVWESGPLVAVILTVNVPWVDELRAQVEFAEPPDAKETLVGLHDTVRPVEGVTDAERPTMPENPPKLVRVIVDELLNPDWKPTLDALAATA